MEPNPNPVAVPKPTPKWTMTSIGLLLHDGRPIGDLRYAGAHHLRAFILAALNAAEEKL